VLAVLYLPRAVVRAASSWAPDQAGRRGRAGC